MSALIEYIEHPDLPNSAQLEQFILGGLMTSKENYGFDYAEVIDYLTVDDFWHERHQEIFKAIDSVYRQSGSICVISVAEELNDRNILELIGGRFYVNELALSYCPAGGIDYHLEKLQEKTKARELIYAGIDLINTAEMSSPNEALLTIQEQIETIQNIGKTESSNVVSEFIDPALEIIQKQASGKLDGFSTGFIQVDGFSQGFSEGKLYILGARPGQGKSALAGNFCLNAAEQGVKSLFISLEMTPEQIVKRLLVSKAKTKDFNIVSRTTLPDLIHIANPENRQLHEVEKLLVKEKTTGKPFQFLVIDYLQLLKVKANSKYEEVTEISQTLKGLTTKYKIPVLALCQLSRLVEQRQDKRPILSDLRDSGSIEQDADQVMFLYRPKYYNPSAGSESEVIFAKQRDGQTGIAYINFNEQIISFS